MAHLMKHTKAACGHMFAHYDRKADHISNDSVDSSRTHLNYNLAADTQPLDQGEFVRKRCSEVKLQNRKDVNVMCSWVLTMPKDLPEDKQQEFFQSSFDFLRDRYGKANVVSAYVHMDEQTPHMHFAFVPVTEDKKKGGFKVSAKEVVNRRDLQTFHNDLQEHLRQDLGFNVSILNEATREGNRSVAELKRETALEQVRQAQERLECAQKRLDELTATLTAKELKQLDATPKRITGGFKGLSPEQAQKLINTTEDYQKRIITLKKEIKTLSAEKAEALTRAEKAESELEKLQPKISMHDLKKTAEKAEMMNQNRIMKKALNLPESAKYDDISRNLKNRNLIQQNHEHKLSR